MKSVCLLAEPDTPAWDFSKKIQEYIKGKDNLNKKDRRSEIPLYKIEMTTFRNKEIMPYVPENIRKKDVYFVQSSNKHPNDWWVEMMLMKDLCLSASAKSLSFVLPNMSYSRQDRKTKSRVPISARSLARSLYSPKVSRLITMDLHAPQIQGFYPEEIPIDNLYSFPTVVDYIRKNHSEDLENMVLISPDAGGVDRTMSFFKRMINADASEKINNHYDFAFTHKLRIKAGEIDKMWFIGNVKDKNALIVDDIFDSGGTAIECKKLLKKNGAKKVMAYATHGLFTKGTKELLKNFDYIMTSNTVYIPKEEDGKIEIIDMAPLFAEAIFRAQKGISISELFE